jgi:hypothetical protein
MTLFGNGGIGRELGTQAPLQFLTHVGNFHAGHDDEFTGKHFARLVIVGKLTGDAAVLTILIPAEAAVRNCFRTDELKAAQQRVAFRDLEFLAHDDDIDEFFVRTKGFRHDEAFSFANGAECGSPEAWATRCLLRVVRVEGGNNERMGVAWRMWYGGTTEEGLATGSPREASGRRRPGVGWRRSGVRVFDNRGGLRGGERD